MSGFDKNRFVDLRPEEEEEFSCGICHGIFNKPVVTPCCQQTYCEECINDWLDHNQNCPNDRRSLTKNALASPPIVVKNLLAKLKIHCDYHLDGCEHVCQLDNLNFHLTRECNFNPKRKCRDCGGLKEENTEHSCIQNLYSAVKSCSDLVRELSLEMISLRESFEVHRQNQQIYDAENDERKQNEDLNNIKIESLSDEFSKSKAEIEVLKEQIKVLMMNKDFQPSPSFAGPSQE